MKKKIVNLDEAHELATNLHKSGKTIVLVGGCFDILHPGHIKFLLEAKRQGDILFVALEPDKTVRKLKGKGRPIYKQAQRALVLASLQMVDCVILLPELENFEDYLELTRAISPDIIAVTAGDSQLENKKKQASVVGARVLSVTRPVANNSTSQIIRLLEKEL